MPAPLNAETLARAPKVLLHDHLDGGLRPQTVLELAEEHGYTDLPESEPEELGRWFREAADSGSLVRYLETFAHTVGVMQRPDAIHRVARECALDLAADGVVYAEVRMAPELLTAGGTPIEEAVEAILDGFRAGSAEAASAGNPIVVGSLLCAMRQNDRWSEVAGLVVRYRDAGVVGFDLAGPEAGFPADRIPEAIALLDRERAHRTIHAGEAFSIESIRSALDGAHAERLGHGVRIIDDVAADGTLGALAQRIRDEQVTLEVAPTSNVQTGAFPSLADHPVDRLHRLGFAVTMNTDNRLMSGVSASSELTDVAATFGWTWDDVQTVTERALAAGFAADAERKRVLDELVRPGYAALRGRGDGAHPVPGNRGAIFAANLGVPAQRPVILPDGLSGHERIRADPAFHPWAQTIASEDAGYRPRPSLSTGRAPSSDGAPPRMTLVHPVAFESNSIHDVSDNSTSENITTENLAEATAAEPTGPTFHQLGLPQPLVTALERRGIRHPFAIQTSALPDALAGRDVLGKAATGSGKTLAFGLPLLARIGADAKQGRRAPRGLVLVPTRELAQQVHDALAPLGQAIGVQLATVYGGAPMYRQIQQLRRGVDVIIATPGRLQDLISQGEASLTEVVVTVLDEADFMADLGFLPVVKELLDQTDRNAQRLLFSATLDGEVDSLVRRYLKDPARHEVVRPGGEAPPAEHLAFSLAFRDKLQVATELASRPGRTIVFARTQLGVDRLAENLKAAGIKAEAIHGGLPQSARKRALEEFTDARSPVLVATDVAARGIHVDDVSLVLHYDPPTDAKTYLHRSGRTARAGAAGVVVSLLLPDQVGQAKRRFRTAKVDPAVDRIRPGDQPILDLVATGVPVEPKERTQRDMRRGGGGPGGRPRRDGDRPGGHRGGPRRSFGDRPRPAGERSSGSSYGERSGSGERSYGDRGPRSGGRPSRPSRYSS